MLLSFAGMYLSLNASSNYYYGSSSFRSPTFGSDSISCLSFDFYYETAFDQTLYKDHYSDYYYYSYYYYETWEYLQMDVFLRNNTASIGVLSYYSEGEFDNQIPRDQWQKSWAIVNATTGSYLQFDAYMYGYNEFVLDNILLQPGPCPTDGKCLSSRNISVCGYFTYAHNVFAVLTMHSNMPQSKGRWSIPL